MTHFSLLGGPTNPLPTLICSFAFMKVTNQDDDQESNQQFNSFSSVFPLGGFGGPEKD